MSKNLITFNIENEIVFAQAIGELLFEDIISHYQELFEHPDFKFGFSAIYDFSQVNQVSGDISHFEQIAKDMGSENVVTVPSYVAIIVEEKNTSMNTIFNSYCHMVDYTFMNAQVFHSNKRAQDWVTKMKATQT